MLVKKYPKCFFENPQQRRPLKKAIISDLEKDGFPAAYELITAGVEWYQSHFGYQYALTAGAKRIDLQGNEVATVTETEEMNAQKKIKEDRQKLEERSAGNSVGTLNSLHKAGRIPADQLSKVTVPPKPIMKAKSDPLLTRLQALLSSANNVLTGTEDETLRSALGTASLKVLIEEAEEVIVQLNERRN
jgi:sRNA-binding protein